MENVSRSKNVIEYLIRNTRQNIKENKAKGDMESKDTHLARDISQKIRHMNISVNDKIQLSEILSLLTGIDKNLFFKENSKKGIYAEHSLVRSINKNCLYLIVVESNVPQGSVEILNEISLGESEIIKINEVETIPEDCIEKEVNKYISSLETLGLFDEFLECLDSDGVFD